MKWKTPALPVMAPARTTTSMTALGARPHATAVGAPGKLSRRLGRTWQPYRLNRLPMIWWEVMARKMFDRKYSLAIRRMWGVGNYDGGR